MIREAPAVTVRQNLGEILNEVQYRHDSVLITKDGKPVAAIVDIGLFEGIRRLREEFERTLAALGSAYAGVDAAVAQADVDAAVRAARRSRRKRRATC
jgi:prevent-host-death family protein